MTDQAKGHLEEYSTDVAKVVLQLDEVRNGIFDGKLWRVNAEAMSQAIVKLAALNSFLGEHVASAEYEANVQDAVYRHARESIKLEKLNKDGTTASEAESVKIVETADMLERVNKSIYIHKLLLNKRKDTSEFIDALRSRLSFMKIEMGEAKNV